MKKQFNICQLKKKKNYKLQTTTTLLHFGPMETSCGANGEFILPIIDQHLGMMNKGLK